MFVANFIGVANLMPAVVRHTDGAAATVSVAGTHLVPVPPAPVALARRRRPPP